MFSSLIPFFALIGFGYFAGRSKMVSTEGVKSLNIFVLYFAMPALILNVLTGLPIEEIFDWRFMAAYASTALTLFIGAWVVQRIILGTNPSLTAVHCVCISWPNAVYLGLPIMLSIHGDKGLIIPMWTLVVDLLITATLAIILLEIAQSRQITLIGLCHKIARGLYTNVFFVSLVGCFVILIFDIPIPEPVLDLTDFIGAAAAPTALFAIGAGLATHKIEGNKIAIASYSFTKLFLAPVIAAFFAYLVFDLPDWLAMSAVIVAALPVASNCFLIAQRYHSGVATSSALILITTIFSLPLLGFILWWYQV